MPFEDAICLRSAAIGTRLFLELNFPSAANNVPFEIPNTCGGIGLAFGGICILKASG